MKQNGLYYKVTQEYLHFDAEKKRLLRERDVLDAEIEVLDGLLIDLNDMLCKHGDHIYEHFEEREEQ